MNIEKNQTTFGSLHRYCTYGLVYMCHKEEKYRMNQINRKMYKMKGYMVACIYGSYNVYSKPSL